MRDPVSLLQFPQARSTPPASSAGSTTDDFDEVVGFMVGTNVPEKGVAPEDPLIDWSAVPKPGLDTARLGSKTLMTAFCARRPVLHLSSGHCHRVTSGAYIDGEKGGFMPVVGSPKDPLCQTRRLTGLHRPVPINRRFSCTHTHTVRHRQEHPTCWLTGALTGRYGHRFWSVFDAGFTGSL